MNESDDLPEHFKGGLLRFVNAFHAHMTNCSASAFPLDLKTHLYPTNSWQQKALENLTRTIFRDVAPSRVTGRDAEYIWGLSMGIAESFSDIAEDKVIGDFLETTYIGKKMAEVDPRACEAHEAALEAYFESYDNRQRKAFTKGQLNGLESLQRDDGEPKYESDRTEAYMLMLLMESQLKFLGSWKNFHEFISTFVEGYKGETRFAACKKMAQKIGYSPVTWVSEIMPK